MPWSLEVRSKSDFTISLSVKVKLGCIHKMVLVQGVRVSINGSFGRCHVLNFEHPNVGQVYFFLN